VVVLLGRWNWWPSKLSHEDHSRDPVTPDVDDPPQVVPQVVPELAPQIRPLAGVPR
jgi:hypothetical protein